MITDEYARLAFRKAILQHVQERLREHLTSSEVEPTALIAEDLPGNLWQVPQHEVKAYIAECTEKIDALDREMSEFTLVRKTALPPTPISPVEQDPDEFNT
jgi:hypothetical protein